MELAAHHRSAHRSSRLNGGLQNTLTLKGNDLRLREHQRDQLFMGKRAEGFGVHGDTDTISQ